MVRRRSHDEHANHEAWAIPYGDLVTLLMAFFVVMYAVSVVDAGKYRVLSNSLVEAFGSRIPVDPIQVGDPVQSPNLMTTDVPRSLAPIQFEDGSPGEQEAMREVQSPTGVAVANRLDAAAAGERDRVLLEIKEMSQEIEGALGTLIDGGSIQVKRKDYWLEITINTSLLFTSGSATLEPQARPILQDVASI